MKKCLILLSLLAFSIIINTLPSYGDGISIRPSSKLVIQQGDSAPILLLIANTGSVKSIAPVQFTFKEGSVSFNSSPLDIEPGGWRVVKATAALNSNQAYGKVICTYGEVSTEINIARGINLAGLTWMRAFTPRTSGTDLKILETINPDAWSAIFPPVIWENTNYAWCKVNIKFSDTWRGKKMKLVIGAIDDNDITYLNGKEIGRGSGWNVKRQYPIPSDIVNWGGENTLMVMVDNFNAGGGLTTEPIIIVPEEIDPDMKLSQQQPPISRPKTGKIGKPLPFRPIHIDNGVLKYPEGDEVALWGVNYYPQSWYQFENMMKLHLDMKATIRKDLDHMVQMGIEIIRIHVFDREISDGKGNIIPNIHLDLLDYLISEAQKRGIYMYFTPIAWWSGPNEVPEAFSQVTSKPGMMYVPAAKEAAINYLKQFMSRKNKYTGNKYYKEPNICFFEVMNEPSYFLYGDLYGTCYNPQGEKPDVLERDRQTLRDLWNLWLKEHDLNNSPEYFGAFRYELMRSYIRDMIGAIRSTGAKQPIALNYGLNGEDLIQAIADSECDALTFSTYPGGLTNRVDGVNLLPLMKQMGKGGIVNLPYYGYALDGRLDKKARAAYEFDNDGTNTSSYMYPAIAASFRSGGLQIACQFQYDSISTAEWNTDWNTHWLNWYYTPTKAASFMLAGEAFRHLPREVQYADPQTELILGPLATSFTHNQSIFSTPDTVMYSRTISDWRPLKFPANPKRIVGTGSSQYVDYGGTGVYKIDTIDANTLKLTINPDARLLGDLMKASLATPLAVLEYNVQFFRLKLPGWSKSRCMRIDGAKEKPVTAADGGWLVTPGEYRIRR